MRRLLPRHKPWWKLAGGALIAAGVMLWVAGAEAATRPSDRGARIDIVLGGGMTVGGIAVIGISERHRDFW